MYKLKLFGGETGTTIIEYTKEALAQVDFTQYYSWELVWVSEQVIATEEMIKAIMGNNSEVMR